MPFSLIRQDITKLEVDAIVNAANTQLQMGGGVCGAIFKAAGAQLLQDACNQLAPIEVGEAVITPAFNLPARTIIHAVGPIYKDGTQQEPQQLKAAYLNSLKLASKNNLASIAFPLISSGIYGYPKDEAIKIAMETIQDYLVENELDVTLVLFDTESFQVSQSLKHDVKSFIDAHYVKPFELERYSRNLRSNLREEHDSFVLDISFSEALFNLIDKKGLSDVTAYKQSNISRKHFSKMKKKEYRPTKKTILALAIGLRLDLNETKLLLNTAGFSLSKSQLLDVIVEYFIRNENYDIYKINEVLFEYDQVLLGN